MVAVVCRRLRFGALEATVFEVFEVERVLRVRALRNREHADRLDRRLRRALEQLILRQCGPVNKHQHTQSGL